MDFIYTEFVEESQTITIIIINNKNTEEGEDLFFFGFAKPQALNQCLSVEVIKKKKKKQ